MSLLKHLSHKYLSEIGWSIILKLELFFARIQIKVDESESSDYRYGMDSVYPNLIWEQTCHKELRSKKWIHWS